MQRVDDQIASVIRLQQRRSFLGQVGRGVGALALASLLPPQGRAAVPPALSAGMVNPLHLAPRAKRVIFLTMAGGPSHFETFDHKPALAKLHGQPMPDSFTRGQPIAQLQNQALKCLAPQFSFRRFGDCGAEICELFPHIGSIADDICIVRSMHTEAINHDPAHTFMNTGTLISGRPSMGSWVTYGLGSDASDLPGFVVLTSLVQARNPQPIASRQWSAGFLPSKFQGVHLRGQGEPVLYLNNPRGVSPRQQRDVVDAVQPINRMYNQSVDDPEIATRISQYEMAFAMQASVPGLMDLSGEPAHILEMYGTKGADGSFAANCLLARRLAERGVRFIQLYHRDWDHHSGLVDFMKICARSADQAAAALVKDLKKRGMLDETLVVWTGEFGRTPMAQFDKGPVGRDHHMKGFSLWLAGGGIKGGLTYGATDDLGYNAVEKPVHVHDLHATMLHQLGIEHTRLTYRFQGRDFRLTDVAGKVVTDLLV